MKDSKGGTKRERIWTLSYQAGDREAAAAVERIASDVGVSSVVARLLWNRGHRTPDDARAFLNNHADVWHDPYLMADMDRAVTRILAAVKAGERIAVYGDYDVDGVTSVTSLYLYLKGIGADVCCYIPSRIGEGYGVSKQAVDGLARDGVRLIVTVDTGITARDEIAYAAALGMETVVTDHHECHAELPVCAAVVNPHRPDCPYPFKELAGVGVVFKVICACESARLGLDTVASLDAMSKQFMDLISIGTIADVMPLHNENRFIVAHGLQMIEETDRCGLRALLDAMASGNTRPASSSARTKRKVNAGLVGFGIAPRINAAGRISHAMKAVDLLLCEDPERAKLLAEELCEINVRRQTEENRIAEEAYRMAESRMEALRAAGIEPRVLVLDDDKWMQGIVGIVASRITEKYGLPTILISFDGSVGEEPSPDDVGKGSGRSVKGMNLVEALADSAELLVRFGGHELAAGLTVRREDIPAFERRINAYAATHLTDEELAVRFEADCEVTMEEMSMELAGEIECMGPFGVANPTPVFMIRNAVLQKVIPLGAGKHTKCLLATGGQTMPAVWFGTATTELGARTGEPVDVLFQLNVNDYQGVRSLQMIVQDMRLSEDCVRERSAAMSRLCAVMEGDAISPDEDIVPSRDDIARVYTMLRADERIGHDVFLGWNLLARINESVDAAMGYVKMRLILRILGEMGVCRIEEPDDGLFTFVINHDAPKTSVDASPLLRRLREQVAAR